MPTDRREDPAQLLAACSQFNVAYAQEGSPSSPTYTVQQLKAPKVGDRVYGLMPSTKPGEAYGQPGVSMRVLAAPTAPLAQECTFDPSAYYSALPRSPTAQGMIMGVVGAGKMGAVNVSVISLPTSAKEPDTIRYSDSDIQSAVDALTAVVNQILAKAGQ
ncbi:MAG TPA: hypothetical protein VJQ61_13005 [Sinomonas sp.]|nr:hypothetical protein [Sinomonas sp.]